MKQAWQWIKDNDVIQRVFALLIAVFLWVYVMANDNSDIRQTLHDMTVRLEGVSVLNDNGLVILSGSNSVVDVEIYGPRSDVNTILQDYKNILRPTADVDNITEPGEYELEYSVTPNSLGTSTVSVSAKRPETISVVVDRLSTASIPVNVQLTGQLATGFTLAGYSASPDAITVRGPETILRQIKSAKVVYDVSSLTSSLQTNVTFTLLDENGDEVTNTYLAPDSPSTTLSINLRQEDEIQLTVELKDSPYLKSYMVQTSIDPTGLKLVGDPEVIQGINQIELDPVDLAEVLEKGLDSFVRIIRLPDGVSLADSQKQFATVSISLDGYAWQTQTLDQRDLPEDPVLEYPEQTFSIELFGAEDVLRRLRESDIRLEPIYELEELVVGENVLPCRITLDDSTIYVKQELEVTVNVTQEALDAALNPETVDPNDPNAPGQPDEPTNTP